MLLSHAHRFIFIKTVKSASTSVEAFFQPLCTPPGQPVVERTPALISSYGIVGRRGPASERVPEDQGFYNHMTASEIRDRCPEFDAFRRFTVVRDPYDQIVSFFHYKSILTNGATGMPFAEAQHLISDGLVDELRKQFAEFVFTTALPNEKMRLCIGDELMVERWLRFEHLMPDIVDLVRDWQLPLPSNRLAEQFPQFKVMRRGSQLPAPPLDAYLSAESVDHINQLRAWHFKTFRYSTKKPSDHPPLH